MNRCIRSRLVRAALVLILTGMAALLSGCCGIHKPFEPMDDNVRIRPGSLAVISADGAETTMRLADALTRQLKERSKFKVLSQEEVGRRVGKYPVTIKETQPQNIDKPVWFAKSEKAKLDAIQAATKTDYLFVVWTGNLSRITSTSSTGGSSVTYTVDVEGNVLEYPKGRPVGFSNFAGSKSKTCCLFGKSEGEDINEMLKNTAEEMADNFISATNSEKPGK